jgi:hypothetical protein
VAGIAVMSALDQAVNDYLALRRGLGFKLEMHGRVLPQFAEFLEQREATLISTALALEFATQPTSGSVVWWHQRLAIVAGFARYLQGSEPRHEVPSSEADRNAAVQAAASGSRRGNDRRVPQPSRERARQQRADPQRAFDRSPLVLPLCSSESA